MFYLPNLTFQSDKITAQNQFHKPNWQIQTLLVNQSKTRKPSKHKLSLSLAQLAFKVNRFDMTNFNTICLVFLADSHLNHFAVILELAQEAMFFILSKSGKEELGTPFFALLS